MRSIGPTNADDLARLAWFEEQEQRTLDRIEEGAKTITQLVTALYGVVFVVLAFGDTPTYLQRFPVQVLGTLSVVCLFGSMLSALVTVYPWRNSAQRDNISAMERAYQEMLRRKVWSLRVAVWLFVLGTGLLASVIMAVLWGWGMVSSP